MFSASRDKEALRIFRELIGVDPSDRARALAEACGDDDALRSRVNGMLEADTGGPDLGWLVLREAEEVASEWREDDEVDLSGRRIGRYRIVRRVGTGGMGTVYEAEQEEPRRRVALKTLKLGAESKDALARFRLEAQVLARMSHPGIAAVLEAGRHEGVPYLAMEYVDGARTLTEYAEEEELDDAARLELFVAVCGAVAYGHARGVVHRDLKPANLLVDRDGRPKIIDFGVARALDPLPEVTVLPTSSGEIVGTLTYMSPEQLSGDPEQVDVQSDVYGLGVVLFELLTGERPKDARGLALTEAVRVLAANEPRRLAALRTELPVELDWIVGKALETDRARRYRTVNDLVDDLRRHRTHEPVQAGPPSTVYRLRKFVRRHRVGVGASALVLLTLIGGVVATSIALVRESAQRERLQRMTEFQASVFSSMQAQALGPDARMADVLEHARRRVGVEFADDPASRAELQRSFGTGFYALGRFDDARQMYEGALEGFLRIQGPLGDDALGTRTALASTLNALEDYAGAVAIYEPLLGDCRRVLGRSSSQTLRTAVLYAIALIDLGEVARSVAVLDEAAVDLEEGLRQGQEYGNIAAMHYDVRARSLSASGRVDEALEVYHEAEAALSSAIGTDHPDLANIRFNHGLLLRQGRRYQDARPLLTDALRVLGPHLGAHHPMVEFITVRLADTIRQSEEQVGEAIPLYEEAIRLKTARGDRPLSIYQARQYLSSVLREDGRPEEAERVHVALLEEIDRDHPDLWFRWFVHLTRGERLLGEGRHEEAEPELLLARELGERFAETRGVDPGRAVRGLVELYVATGRSAEAAALRDEERPDEE